MFDSLKQWLSNLAEGPELFEAEARDVTEVALASVLVHSVKADGRVSQHERARFGEIFRAQFKLSDDRITELFDQASHCGGDLREDLETLRDHIETKSESASYALLVALNDLIAIDGIHPAELKVLEQAKGVLFPRSDGA